MTQKNIFIFVHGWGVDSTVWDSLLPFFRQHDVYCHDLGFYGNPRGLERFSSFIESNHNSSVIAIGYSLGFLWLLKNKPFKWNGLIGINSFPKFTKAPDFPKGVSSRVTAGMKRRLHHDPLNLLQEVYQKIKWEKKNSKNYDVERLIQGLDWLENWDERKTFKAEFEKNPTMILAAKDDLVVPESLTKNAFSEFNNSLSKRPVLNWSPNGGGHGLPNSQTKWCAEKIHEFVKDNF